jgi:dihydropyrimidinase/dihydroorotase
MAERADLVLKNGNIVSSHGIIHGGVAIKDGKFIAVGKDSALPEGQKVIDVGGKHILPGLIDPEVHLGIHRPITDDLISETKAAASTGVTTWGMQLTSPNMQMKHKLENDPSDIVSFKEVFPNFKEAGEKHSRVDFFLTPILANDAQAEEIPEYAEKFGITSFKYYLHMMRPENSGCLSQNRMGFFGFDDGTVYRGMEHVARLGPPGIVSLHCENWGIVRVLEERLRKQGRMDIGAWDDRSPHFAEAAHVRQFTYFAGLLKCPLYIQHCTCDETMDEVVRARKDGLTIYAQTAPCYLSLAKDTWKLNVPLRSKETIERIWIGLREGRIHCVGTDHVNHGVPRHEMEVKGDVWKSVSGFSSRVEAYMQVMLSLGVNQGRITIERMVEACCESNAKVFGLFPKKGVIRVGSDGDVVIVDLNKRATVKPDMLYTSSGWSIYEGWEFTGWPVTTIVRGNIVAEWSNQTNSMEMVGDPVGRYVPRKPGSQFLEN